MSRTVSRTFAIVFMIFALAACGEDDPSEGKVDAGTNLDGGNSANANANNATTNNATTNNANTSTGMDAGNGDAGPADAGDDAGTMDAGTDATTDASAGDAGTDMGADMGADVAMATYDTCEGAIDVTAGGTFTGSTAGANSDYGPPIGSNCPSRLIASFADVVYSVTPTAETTYDFEVTLTGANSMWDPSIYIQTDCSSDACVDGTNLNGPGSGESLNGFVASANTTYFIIIDSMTFRDGDFTFEVTVNP